MKSGDLIKWRSVADKAGFDIDLGLIIVTKNESHDAKGKHNVALVFWEDGEISWMTTKRLEVINHSVL